MGNKGGNKEKCKWGGRMIKRNKKLNGRTGCLLVTVCGWNFWGSDIIPTKQAHITPFSWKASRKTPDGNETNSSRLFILLPQWSRPQGWKLHAVAAYMNNRQTVFRGEGRKGNLTFWFDHYRKSTAENQVDLE